MIDKKENKRKALDAIRSHQALFAIGWDDEDGESMTASVCIDMGGSSLGNFFDVLSENIADVVRSAEPEDEEGRLGYYKACVAAISASLIYELGITGAGTKGGASS